MKSLKIAFLLTLMLGLSNCKVTFSQDGEVAEINGEEYYLGSVDELKYLRKQYDATAMTDYRSLDLTVSRKGKILAKAQDSTCEMKGQIDASRYAELVTMVEEAKKLIPEPITTLDGQLDVSASSDATNELPRVGGPTNELPRVDAPNDGVPLARNPIAPYPRPQPQESIDLKYEDGDQEKIYLEGGSPQVEVEQAISIREVIDAMIDELLEDCQRPTPDYAVTFLKWNQKATRLAINDGLGQTMSRKFKIALTGDGYHVKGRQSTFNAQASTLCSIEVNEKLPDGIARLMQSIEVRKQRMVCMYMPHGETFLHMTFKKDGVTQRGTEGCHATNRLLQHYEFKRAFEKWLEGMSQRCHQLARPTN